MGETVLMWQQKWGGGTDDDGHVGDVAHPGAANRWLGGWWGADPGCDSPGGTLFPLLLTVLLDLPSLAHVSTCWTKKTRCLPGCYAVGGGSGDSSGSGDTGCRMVVVVERTVDAWPCLITHCPIW